MLLLLYGSKLCWLHLFSQSTENFGGSDACSYSFKAAARKNRNTGENGNTAIRTYGEKARIIGLLMVNVRPICLHACMHANSL